MTKEEAIKVIKSIIDVEQEYGGKDNIDALNMAIQALSQEPTEKPTCDRNICVSNEYNGIGCDKCIVNKAEQEPCADVVSRQLKIGDEIYIRANVNEIRNDYIICENKGGYFGTVREEIRPSVRPQEQTGHWIRISPAGIYECSECGQHVMTSDICAYKFCHGCGCRMESEDKE